MNYLTTYINELFNYLIVKLFTSNKPSNQSKDFTNHVNDVTLRKAREKMGEDLKTLLTKVHFFFTQDKPEIEKLNQEISNKNIKR